MNQQFLTTALPTFPVQDKFGSLLIQFGFNKIELATLIIGAGMSAQAGGKVLPETVADAAFEIALCCLEKCDEEAKKAAIDNSTKVDLIHAGK